MGLRLKTYKLLNHLNKYLPENPVCYIIGTQECGFKYKDLRKYNCNSANVNPEENCDLKVAIKALGWNNVKTIDINDLADIKADLNKDLPEYLKNTADIVVEVATIEHIFDVRKAMFNLNGMLKINGIIFHSSPISFYQHGFYNFNPLFFDSLYMGSGYKQIFRTIEVTIYNPFFVIDTTVFSKKIKYLFSISNRLALKSVLCRFHLPLSLKGNNSWLNVTHFLLTHFGLPKNFNYCCAYQKTADSELRIPYDVERWAKN